MIRRRLQGVRRPAVRLAMLSLAALAAVGGLAAACGDDDTADTTDVPTIRVQLDWLPNTNHTGVYVAQAQGWYADAAVQVEILPFAESNPDVLVDAGQADVAFSFPTVTPFSRAAGLDVVSIAAVIQHNPAALAVLADSGLNRPRDLDGTTFGGFGLPYEEPQFRAVIQNDGGQGDFTLAVLNTAAYEALYNGRVDVAEMFLTWEGIDAAQQGIALRTFSYADSGIPDFPGVVLISSEKTIAEKAETLRRFLQATRRGYEWAAAHPDEAGALLIDTAGADVLPNPDLVRESSRLLASAYYLDADGRWGTQTAAQWTDYPRWLYEHGLLSDADGDPLTAAPDYTAAFTTSLLEKDGA